MCCASKTFNRWNTGMARQKSRQMGTGRCGEVRGIYTKLMSPKDRGDKYVWVD